AFDREGYRLGRGAGFYDRFLTSILRTPSMKKPMLVGVGFDCQLIDRVPREPHDILLDAVVTPSVGVTRAALS
ncbi:MAG: 5-formyltetrahydrofolate cyclo-ligase, partial [Planctomycetota bacterium]